MKTVVMCIAFASVALFSTAAAQASGPVPRGEPFAVRIPVADLDLRSEEGRRTLGKRARTMAAQTCAPQRFALYEPRSLRACRRTFESAAATAVARAENGRDGR